MQLNQLTRHLRKEVDKEYVKAALLAKEVAIAVLDTVIPLTRVDTSEAVSNWQIEYGSPPIEVLPAHAVGSKGSTADISIAIVKAKAANKLLTRKKIGIPIYISNNAGHIHKIDPGFEAAAEAVGNFLAG